MYKITCYKVDLSRDRFINSTISDMMDLCQYDYSIETTQEIYYATREREIRFLYYGKDGVVAYYFTKSIEVPS